MQHSSISKMIINFPCNCFNFFQKILLIQNIVYFKESAVGVAITTSKRSTDAHSPFTSSTGSDLTQLLSDDCESSINSTSTLCAKFHLRILMMKNKKLREKRNVICDKLFPESYGSISFNSRIFRFGNSFYCFLLWILIFPAMIKFRSSPTSPLATNERQQRITRPNVIQNPVHRPVATKIPQSAVPQVATGLSPLQPSAINPYNTLLHEFWRRSSALGVTTGGIWVPPQPNHGVAATPHIARPCSPGRPPACSPAPAFAATASPPFGTTLAGTLYPSTTPTKASFFAAQPQPLLPLSIPPPPLATSPTAFQAASSNSPYLRNRQLYPVQKVLFFSNS